MPIRSPSLLRRSTRLAPRLAADRRGAVMIEFAICAAAFFALLMACAQTALIFFVQQVVQTAAEGGARHIMTGQAGSAAMTSDQFRAYACSQIPPVIDCSKLLVDVRTVASFDAIDATAPVVTYDSSGKVTGGLQFNSGGAGAIMMVRVMYLWNIQLGPLSLDFSNAGRGKRLVTGTMVFKSEPYTT